MGASDLLRHLRATGVELRVDAGRLLVSPASLLTDDACAAIREQRDDLLQLVADPDPRVTCSTCVHAHGHWCGAHPRSGLPSGYIGGIEGLAQHCPAWQGEQP